jgi:hypothetical protein
VKKPGNAGGAKGPDREHESVEKKGEPLERELHYGKTGERKPDPGIGETGPDTRETLSTETESEPKGEAGTEVSVLYVV